MISPSPVMHQFDVREHCLGGRGAKDIFRAGCKIKLWLEVKKFLVEITTAFNYTAHPRGVSIEPFIIQTTILWNIVIMN